ncbi:MAG: SurA domain protein [candidate division TM6 bacterium GW2011_GWF2_28_16]|nr:MAG: SurA domain protein [candidate division TM6 bacterium GW2011_GWF2_28_16]
MKFRIINLFLIFGFVTCAATQDVTKDVKKDIKQDVKKVEQKQDKVKKDTVDKIVVRVNGVNILKSDLEKPQIISGGQRMDLESAVTQELLIQKASEHKMLATSAEVDKQIASLKIRNGMAEMSDEDFEKELKQEGLTIADYKGQIAKFMAVERLKGAEFSERVVVTAQEVEDFYKKNPSWSEEKYNLQICDLEDKDLDKDGNLIADLSLLKWEDLGWILKKDLDKSLAVVSGLQKGEMSKPIKTDDSYKMVKVLDRSEKNLRTMDERYTEIEALLQAQKRDVFEKEFEVELKKDASIVYLS